MSRSPKVADSLIKLLEQSGRPIYVIDSARRIVYCNPALAAWIHLEPKRILGRRVEFHSEEPPGIDVPATDLAPLTDLCPPPRVLAGQAGRGTISCQALEGRMLHREADFLPLGQIAKTTKQATAGEVRSFGVLVMLAAEDYSPLDMTSDVSEEAASDQLHCTIRRFRRGQAQHYSIHSLLGVSASMHKVRAQVEAAATGPIHVLILGPRGSGRGHIARAIHYGGGHPDLAQLIVVDCELVTDDLFLHTLEKLRPSSRPGHTRRTLLLENLEFLPSAQQKLLLAAIRHHQMAARIIATLEQVDLTRMSLNGETASKDIRGGDGDGAGSTRNLPTTLDQALVEAVSLITIRVPPLAERLEDLPILAQFFVEACNRGNSKQIGSIRSEALDTLALYSWPGELDQLRDVIESAHATCVTDAIASTDLPPMFFHAFRSALHGRHKPDRINLDELLATIEKEAIRRALALSKGNKSEAAGLLGMTRPRLYRRLEQLGLLSAEWPSGESPESPEFIEQDGQE